MHSSIDVYRKSKPDLVRRVFVYCATSRSPLDPKKIIDIDDDFEKGDLCWIETPLNPTGEVRNIGYYADKVGLNQNQCVKSGPS